MKASDTLQSISQALPSLFGESQKSAANHRKNAIALRKLQEQCAKATASKEDFLAGEEAFNLEFVRAVNQILPVKKKEASVTRVIKFVAAYVQYTQEKDAKERSQKQQPPTNDDEEMEDTTSSRFVEFLMRHLLRGINAKDKAVRSHVCQLIALCVNSLGEIDDDVYQALKKGLYVRLHDKESSVRLHAVIALSRLQGADEDEAEDDGLPVTAKLIDILQGDPSAEVRRAVLFNIEQTRETLPYILERARDADAINRRCVFIRSMQEIGDFRVLSIEDRERLLEWGLTDRDPNVNKACSKMLAGSWIQHTNNNLLEFLERLDVIGSKIADKALIAFFQARSDIFESLTFDDNFWENLTPESAFLLRVFADYCADTGNEDRLEAALPELTRHAFIVEKYVKLLEEANDINAVMDDGEGDHAEVSFIVEQLLAVACKMDYGDEIGRRRMDNLVRSILMKPDLTDGIMTQAVDIIRKFALDENDFTRVMIEIVSEIREPIDDTASVRDDEDDTMSTALDDLSLDATPRRPIRSMSQRPTVDRLQKRMESLSLERFANVNPDEKDRTAMEEMLLSVKCLHLTKCMLIGNHSSLQGNVAIYGLLNDVIVPAVRSHDAAIRERGIECLGLCCILDSDLGQDNLGLFFHQVKEGHDELQVKCLQVIFDMIMTHGLEKLSAKFPSPDAMLQFIHFALQHPNAKVQAVACEGTAKLMLAGFVRSSTASQESSEEDGLEQSNWSKAGELLHILLLLYFDPESANNQTLRQCLSYFFPVYCYSSPFNQAAMQKIFVPTLKSLAAASRRINDETKMISGSQIATQLVDYSNPRKVVVRNEAALSGRIMTYMAGQIDVAIKVLAALHKTKNKDLVKTYIGCLSKLYIPDLASGTVDLVQLKAVLVLVGSVRKQHALTELTLRNSMNKFEAAIIAAGADEEDGMAVLEQVVKCITENEGVISLRDEHGDSPLWVQVWLFLDRVEDGDVEVDDETDEEQPAPRRKSTAAKKKKEVVASDSDEEVDEAEELDSDPEAEYVAPTPKAKTKTKAKPQPQSKGRRRAQESDDEDEEIMDDDLDAMETPKRAIRPQRAASARVKKVTKKLAEEEVEDDFDDWSD